MEFFDVANLKPGEFFEDNPYWEDGEKPTNVYMVVRVDRENHEVICCTWDSSYNHTFANLKPMRLSEICASKYHRLTEIPEDLRRYIPDILSVMSKTLDLFALYARGGCKKV